jgi:DNA modification methylase
MSGRIIVRNTTSEHNINWGEVVLQINRVHQGDCLQLLKQIDDNSIDMCITSPPYWALRNYGVDGQIGLEPNMKDYIEKLCLVFDEVKRVLKKSGTCWINIGDTYARNKNFHDSGTEHFGKQKYMESQLPNIDIEIDIKEKSQCAIPERLKIAMIERGWICRNTIIWHKPNAMPESVTDRFTDDYEYLYFFTKSSKYYFHQILEPYKEDTYRRAGEGPAKGYKSLTDVYSGMSNEKINAYHKKVKTGQLTHRNKRSVWSISTHGYSGPHFATYPEELVEPCINAGCPMNGVVLDPFIGTGTSGVVALRLNRQFIGLELNPEYVKLANKRIFSGSSTLDSFVEDKVSIVSI